MLKFKSSESISDTFDLVPISSSKSNNSNTIEINDNIIESDENIIDTFISLYRQISPESSKSLKAFLLNHSLWDLLAFLSSEEFSLIKSTLIHFYFSIPDRISSVCKFETDEFFFQKSFLGFTEASLIPALNRDPSLINRFIFALDHFGNFAMNKLVSIDGFWDSLNSSLISQLPHSTQQVFLASLIKNILHRNFTFKKLCKIFKSLRRNLLLLDSSLVSLIYEEFIEKGLLEYSDLAQLICALICGRDDSNSFLIELCETFLKNWSNDSLTFRLPFNSQLHNSSCFVIVLSLISPEMFSIKMEEAFMTGVQSRLDHSDNQIRIMATCVAEILNQMHPESESKLDFGLDLKNEIVSHLRNCQKLCGQILFNVTFELTENKVPEDELHDNLEDESDFDFDDLKPISSLLKEKEPKNSKTPLPRFLPDCLKCLRTNEDAELVEKVLKQIEKTFLESPRLSRQIHAASTFNTILNLNYHFDIENFDDLRKFSMQKVLIDQVKSVGPELIDGIFKSNKLVLGQKMELLMVICSSAQEIFREKGKNSTLESLPNFNSLDYYEKSFLISESVTQASKSKTTVIVINEFLDNLGLPLLVQSVRNFSHFKRNHSMFLEKFLWLQAIILNFSQNYLPYDRLVEKYLDLVHLTLTSGTMTTISGATTKLIEQVPIQKAILIGTSVVLSAWPVGLPVLQFYPRLQEIYSFLDEVANGPGFKEDSQLQALGTSVAIALQDLTDPQKLLKESVDQISLDLKTVKITNLATP